MCVYMFMCVCVCVCVCTSKRIAYMDISKRTPNQVNCVSDLTKHDI